eukprot:NODE_14677_length_338_cov_2.041522_g13514_i0.p3 GENE.NODE_14677_length_338_cov_2.041522_g13514_i0~~NODE_14677_length_338_cov_2.041522_g13514_i0.p3  ORF type:complete len:68 (+),score=10.65 NODE_14677_length_338_cov_2.041522_g13514_i0:97-300(+)
MAFQQSTCPPPTDLAVSAGSQVSGVPPVLSGSFLLGDTADWLPRSAAFTGPESLLLVRPGPAQLCLQ